MCVAHWTFGLQRRISHCFASHHGTGNQCGVLVDFLGLVEASPYYFQIVQLVCPTPSKRTIFLIVITYHVCQSLHMTYRS